MDGNRRLVRPHYALYLAPSWPSSRGGGGVSCHGGLALCTHVDCCSCVRSILEGIFLGVFVSVFAPPRVFVDACLRPLLSAAVVVSHSSFSFLGRQQLPSSPLMYRTAWHVPLFPHDLVLKICLHEDDRSHVVPTLSAFDPRGCYLLVVPRDSPAPSPVTDMHVVVETQGNGSFNGGVGDIAEKLAVAAPSSAVSTPAVTSSSSGSSSSAAAAASAAAIASAAAAAAASVAASAADEAWRASQAMQAGTAVPWTWKESEVGVEERESTQMPMLNVRPVLAVVGAGTGEPAEAGESAEAGEPMEAGEPAEARSTGRREAGGMDVYVWKGSQSHREY